MARISLRAVLLAPLIHIALAHYQTAMTISQADVRNIPLVNNRRDLKPVGHFRKVYRSPDASRTCNATSACQRGSKSSSCHRTQANQDVTWPYGVSDSNEWSYYDQAHWSRFHSPGFHNECGHPNHQYTFPGESPINVDPEDTVLLTKNELVLDFSGDSYVLPRASAPRLNTGHSMRVPVCMNGGFDCMAKASFGTWPKVLRGADPSQAVADRYFLVQFHFHWGLGQKMGSEHEVCGQRQAGSLHLLFMNARNLTQNREDPDSGTLYVVLEVLLASDAQQDNPDYGPLFKHMEDVVSPGDLANSNGPITIGNLLPKDYKTKFYSYPGSLTIPPCQQQATWIVFENFVSLSPGQLHQLTEMTSQTAAQHPESLPVKAILFPFSALAIGTLTKRLLSHYAPNVPYVACAMVEGFLIDLWQSQSRKQATNPLDKDELNSMQESVDLWAEVDGTLVLYGFLPILLFSQAVTLNVHQFRKSLGHVLLLAGPGVVFTAFLLGVIVCFVLPYGWDWNFAISFGAILAATDAATIKRRLNTYGASPTLSMLIQGESIVNDGTAMILFSFFWNIYMHWNSYDAGTAISFFLTEAVAGPIFGMCVGLFVYACMSRASRKHSQLNASTQVSITLCTAYLVFFVTDMELKMSGLIAVVSASLPLAAFGWQIASSETSLRGIWFELVFFCTTVLYFLTGLLVHRAFQDGYVSVVDIGWSVVLYIFTLLVRVVMIVICYPVLSKTGKRTSLKEAGFIAWSGTRGAVAIALVAFVRQTLDSVDERLGAQAFFHVAGNVFLTTILQGTSAVVLLRYSGLIGVSPSQRLMMDTLHEQLQQHLAGTYAALCVRMQHDAVELLDLFSDLKVLVSTEFERPALAKAVSQTSLEQPRGINIEALEQQLGLEPGPCQGQVHMLREILLKLVRAAYHDLVDQGRLPRSSESATRLLNSIGDALETPQQPLRDWDGLHLERRSFYLLFLASAEGWLSGLTFWSGFHYHLLLKEQERYYMAVSFIEAHKQAQQKLSGLIFEARGGAEEAEILLESALEVERAEAFLESMGDLFRIIKTNIIGQSLVATAREFLHKVTEKGLLCEADATLLTQLEAEELGLRAMMAREMRLRRKSHREPSSPELLPTFVGAQREPEAQGASGKGPAGPSRAFCGPWRCLALV